MTFQYVSKCLVSFNSTLTFSELGSVDLDWFDNLTQKCLKLEQGDPFGGNLEHRPDEKELQSDNGITTSEKPINEDIALSPTLFSPETTGCPSPCDQGISAEQTYIFCVFLFPSSFTPYRQHIFLFDDIVSDETSPFVEVVEPDSLQHMTAETPSNQLVLSDGTPISSIFGSQRYYHSDIL